MSKNKLSEISLVFIALVLVFFLLNQFQSFLRPFVIAIILSFLFVPITRFSKEKKIWIILNTLVTTVVLVIIVVLIGSFFSGESSKIEQIPNQSNNTLHSNLSVFYESTNINLFNHKINLNSVLPKEEFSSFINKVVSQLLNSISNLISELLLVILFLLFLPTHDSMINRISKKLDKKKSYQFNLALKDIEKSIRSYLLIKTIISLGTALVSLIIMLLFGVKFAFIFFLIIFVFNFIPSIGSIVAVSIVIISEFVLMGFSSALIFLGVLLILVQILFGNIIEPKFAGKKLELSPVIILLSLFFWGSIWGVGGMLLAVPLTSIIKITLEHMNTTRKIVPFLS